MINALIIDDEAHCIARLNSLLEEYCGDKVHVLGSFQNTGEVAAAIKKLHPDLVFLDVQMNDKSGFDLLQEIPEINFEVVFTTAFDKYAVQAFKFSAVDYLLKPVDPDDLIQAVQKVDQKIESNGITQKMDLLFHNLQTRNPSLKKIAIPTMDGQVYVAVNDIIRCQAQVNYTLIFLKDKSKMTVAKTLKEYEGLLEDHNFYRVHNSHLINLAYVQKYNKGKGGTVSMIDRSEIEVSSPRKEELLRRLSAL